MQPLLVVFEDLHWIDTETQALLDALVESLPIARLLLLVNHRPEYHHRWGGKTYYSSSGSILYRRRVQSVFWPCSARTQVEPLKRT